MCHISTISRPRMCGGTLISQNHVVTAASCLTRVTATNITVVLGLPHTIHNATASAVTFNVETIYRHPYFLETIHTPHARFDVAVLKLIRQTDDGLYISKSNRPFGFMHYMHLIASCPFQCLFVCRIKAKHTGIQSIG